jgi:hypothetical protein
MRQLVSNKDSLRALGIMQTQTKKWSGQVSKKGLIGFFSLGYAARDIDEQPGGFTVFMFWPVSVHRPKSQNDIHGQVKAMFGKSDLDNAAVPPMTSSCLTQYLTSKNKSTPVSGASNSSPTGKESQLQDSSMASTSCR